MVAQSGWLKGMNPTTSIVAKVVVLCVVVYALISSQGMLPEAVAANAVFDSVRWWISSSLKWFYVGLVAFLLFFCIWIGISKYGNIRLGDDDDRPEFSYFSWFSMLFGAGMGIGLMFWSIGEPMYHFANAGPDWNPHIAEGLSKEAATRAMTVTFFHWGLHPWAIYVVVALTLAYFGYRKKEGLTISASLSPWTGSGVKSKWGHAVDVLAVFGTTFGVATSLGFGAQQIATGLYNITGMGMFVDFAEDGSTSPNDWAMVVLIAIITAAAVTSAVTGVGKGIRILSELNLWLSIAILVFLLAYGPTGYILNTFLQSTGDYLASVVPMSFYTQANEAFTQKDWQGWWTVFYWGWWISWAPFVGMFIARISRGRTIRDFVMGVLLVPTLLTFIWLSLFGGTALYYELFHTVVNEAGETVSAIGEAGIVAATKADVTNALYKTFDILGAESTTPGAGFVTAIFTVVATLLIITYFVTSSDSGTLVITTLLSDGDDDPPKAHRIIWGATEGGIAAILLLMGGLGALQTAAITAALPFSVVMIFMMVGLVKALGQEKIPGYTGAGHRVHGGLSDDRVGPQ